MTIDEEIQALTKQTEIIQNLRGEIAELQGRISYLEDQAKRNFDVMFPEDHTPRRHPWPEKDWEVAEYEAFEPPETLPVDESPF